MISRTRVEPRDDIYAPSGIVMCQEGLFCAWKVFVTCWNANENCEAIFGGKNAGLPFMFDISVPFDKGFKDGSSDSAASGVSGVHSSAEKRES